MRVIKLPRVRKIYIFRLKNQETNKSKTKNIESKDTTTKLKKYSLHNSSRFKLFFKQNVNLNITCANSEIQLINKLIKCWKSFNIGSPLLT